MSIFLLLFFFFFFRQISKSYELHLLILLFKLPSFRHNCPLANHTYTHWAHQAVPAPSYPHPLDSADPRADPTHSAVATDYRRICGHRRSTPRTRASLAPGCSTPAWRALRLSALRSCGLLLGPWPGRVHPTFSSDKNEIICFNQLNSL